MNKQNKRAFTLIELLVVVLIIGILAAVAVPQYQKAVIKSRFAEAFTNLTTIGRALQACMLEKQNETECYIDQLDISLPGTLDTETLPGFPMLITDNFRYDATAEYSVLEEGLTKVVSASYLHDTDACMCYLPDRGKFVLGMDLCEGKTGPGLNYNTLLNLSSDPSHCSCC